MPINSIALAELQQRIAELEDTTAYKKIFFLFFLPLKSFSFTIVKSNEIAEEIVSDILINIWTNKSKILGIENLKMYLYTSVKNASIKKIQQINKNSIISIDDYNVEIASSDLNAENIIISKEIVYKIEEAINQLPPQCKIIFKLAKEDKLKYKEIAQLLNISIKTIDNQIATALKKITATLNVDIKKNNLNF